MLIKLSCTHAKHTIKNILISEFIVSNNMTRESIHPNIIDEIVTHVSLSRFQLHTVKPILMKSGMGTLRFPRNGFGYFYCKNRDTRGRSRVPKLVYNRLTKYKVYSNRNNLFKSVSACNDQYLMLYYDISHSLAKHK